MLQIKNISKSYTTGDFTQRALDGVSRDWTGYIKDHDGFTDYDIKTTDKGVIKVDLDISAKFFMSDPHYKSNENTNYPKPEPYLYIVAEESENEYLGNLYEGDDVKIISFEYDEPIENIYK